MGNIRKLNIVRTSRTLLNLCRTQTLEKFLLVGERGKTSTVLTVNETPRPPAGQTKHIQNVSGANVTDAKAVSTPENVGSPATRPLSRTPTAQHLEINGSCPGPGGPRSVVAENELAKQAPAKGKNKKSPLPLAGEGGCRQAAG